MISYGEQHFNDHVTIDYFAVSLPDMLIFDDDLDKRNRLHCWYMMGLGQLGLINLYEAEQALQNVLKEDINHTGASIHLQLARKLLGITSQQVQSQHIN